MCVPEKVRRAQFEGGSEGTFLVVGGKRVSAKEKSKQCWGKSWGKEEEMEKRELLQSEG